MMANNFIPKNETEKRITKIIRDAIHPPNEKVSSKSSKHAKIEKGLTKE
jgi:hypothetical protein